MIRAMRMESCMNHIPRKEYFNVFPIGILDLHTMMELTNQRMLSFLRFSQVGTCTFQRRALFSRSEFPITDTELKLIAAAAMMGLSRIPKAG